MDWLPGTEQGGRQALQRVTHAASVAFGAQPTPGLAQRDAPYHLYCSKPMYLEHIVLIRDKFCSPKNAHTLKRLSEVV